MYVTVRGTDQFINQLAREVSRIREQPLWRIAGSTHADNSNQRPTILSVISGAFVSPIRSSRLPGKRKLSEEKPPACCDRLGNYARPGVLRRRPACRRLKPIHPSCIPA